MISMGEENGEVGSSTVFPALAGRFFTTETPGKPEIFLLDNDFFFFFLVSMDLLGKSSMKSSSLFQKSLHSFLLRKLTQLWF